jgi:hypothetical protein
MRHLASALIVLVVVTLADAAAGAVPPGGSRSALCTLDPFPLAISPGLTVTPAVVRFATTSPAVVTCHGWIDGHQVTGPGRFSVHGTMSGPAGGATCAQANGEGRGVFTLPTADGPVEMINTFTFEATSTGGIFRGDALSGLFTFGPPVKGDCVSAPLTSATVTIVGVAS